MKENIIDGLSIVEVVRVSTFICLIVTHLFAIMYRVKIVII